MFGGAILLILSASAGEMHPFPHLSAKAVGALLYLVVAGSLVGFSAFVWLLGRMPATRVASHAYINPVVAVALGYFFAGEVVTPRMLLGTALIVASVALILIKDKAEAPKEKLNWKRLLSRERFRRCSTNASLRLVRRIA